MSDKKKQRDYHAEYLRRKTRGSHPKEIAKYGKTLPKRTGTGAEKGGWVHNKVKSKNMKPSRRSKYQLKLIADYGNEKTGEIREKITSFSYVTKYGELPDKSRMLNEAVNYAQAHLGGSSWFLIKIRQRQYIKWTWTKRGRVPETGESRY